MKGELLSMIEFLEKDRGLDRGTLVEAVEQAIETAARKTDGFPPGIHVRIDQDSGAIRAYTDVLVIADGEEGPTAPELPAVTEGEKAPALAEGEKAPDAPVPEPVQPWWHLADVKKYTKDAKPGTVVHIELDPVAFSRISAQTAKQVIIQRIREAEREKILTEYTQKVGDLVYGTVSRFERGNMVVDIGKTEALLQRREQSPMERYRPGDRIRTLVLDVKDTEEGRVPRVMLSRGNAGLIRRLFEIEVPEIYDGIVEIKAIAREAGFRTKIAVVSHDPKIDSVGACVGVRGSRVKNIVQEIGGEKIDIVRWSGNIEELVANALQPVEIARTFADAENEHILVVVPDEQLSLAIGKSGQNIRLTSKLTGWKVDVVRQSEAERVAREQGIELTPQQPAINIFGVKAEQKSDTPVPPRPRTTQQRVASIFRAVDEIGQEAPPSDTLVKDIEGVTERQAQLLGEASITTVSQLLAADRETLLGIPGMGEKTLDKIIESVKAQS